MADLTPTLQAISRRFQAIETRLEDVSRVEIPSSLEAINVRDYGALGDGTVLGEPWVKVTLFAWICIWVIPFWCLLGQRPKNTGWFLATIATVSAFGFWIERNVLIWPSLVPENTWAFLGVVQIGTALGFLGLFVLTLLVFMRRFPSLAVPRK